MPVMRRQKRNRPGQDVASAGRAPGRGLSVTRLQVGKDEYAVLSMPLADAVSTASLTEAERDVAGYVAAGRSNAEIAELRSTSTRTVANQVAAVYRKLGVTTRTQLAAVLGALRAQRKR